MSLDIKLLNKIRDLYEIATQINKYWVHIDFHYAEKFDYSELNINVYTYTEDKTLASVFNKNIKLNNEIAEKEVQQAIEKIKELITPNYKRK